MDNKDQHLEALHDIKQMMERSSRFISLSGISGIAAGVCALIGAAFAYSVIQKSNIPLDSVYNTKIEYSPQLQAISLKAFMGAKLYTIAIGTFVAAFLLSFLFTYLKSRKNNLPLWSSTTRRLLLSVSVPLLVGGIYLWQLMENGVYGYIGPGCLLFYGLALLNGSKYTLGEIRYLGYSMTIVGLISLMFIGYGIYFWALGFGVLHILYGSVMWWKYERKVAV